jgi:hypothetical protein
MAIGRIPEPLAGIQEAILDAKGDLISAIAADTPARLAVGTNNTVLTADSATSTGLKWAVPDPLTTKGDLFTFSTVEARLPVGANGTTLVADSSEATGLKWATAGGGGKVLQVVSAQLTTNTTISSTTMTDTGLTATITPTLATSKIWVVITMPFWMERSSSVNGAGFNLLRGSTVIREQQASNQTTWHNFSGISFAQFVGNFPLNYLDSPSTTSATTYKVQAATWDTSSGGTISVPHKNTPVPAAVITLLEIGA